MNERHNLEQERSWRLDRLLCALEAENQQDAACTAALLEVLAPFAALTVPAHVREAFDARFGAEDPAPHATTRTKPATTAAFIRA